MKSVDCYLKISFGLLIWGNVCIEFL